MTHCTGQGCRSRGHGAAPAVSPQSSADGYPAAALLTPPWTGRPPEGLH